MDRANAFEIELDRNPANYAPLKPLSFIERTADVYHERTAVVHGARNYKRAPAAVESAGGGSIKR
ncbi:MAG: hypothetical protein AAB654_16075, partial [Acidobacteriota bacterium]